MNVSEAVARRRSIREFTDQPVDEALLRSVLEKARMAPSGYNFQPWEAVAISGAPIAQLSARMLAAEPQSSVEYQLEVPDVPQRYLDRRGAIMAERWGSIGIGRDDAAGRQALWRRNYEFFGAPAALLIFLPRVMGVAQWADAGIWLQTVMLLLTEVGLGTCPQESLYAHGRLIKDFVGVSDETHVLWCGLAIGWPDWSAPLNNYPRPRVGLEESVRFMGFGQ